MPELNGMSLAKPNGVLLRQEELDIRFTKTTQGVFNIKNRNRNTVE
jgi:hypothetical protein